MASYTVKRGDTLSAIAKKNGTTVDAIAKASGISNPNVIYAGQKITIPSAAKTNKNIPKNNSKNTSKNGSKNITKNKTTTPTSKDLGKKTSSALGRLEELTSKDSIISQDVWDGINKEWVEPKEATSSYAKAKAFLDNIESGRTSYSDKVGSKAYEIENRDPFEYDVDSDQLFQQALASAMNSGKTAMQDTIGQASALTGGYGSTYATSAGNQAYNAFIEDAYNNLPKYYQMAMEAYQMETDTLFRELGMYMDLDNTEWSRYIDGYNASMDFANTIHDNAWGKYTFDVNTAISKGNLQLNEHNTLVNDASTLYGAYSNEYWNQTQFDENVRQFDATQGLKNKEYMITTGDTDMDGVLSASEKTAMNTNYTYDSNGNIVRANAEGEYTYEEMEEAKTSEGTQRFNTSILSPEELRRRGYTIKIGEKEQRFDNYNQYVYAVLDRWFKDGKVTKNEAAYLKGAYGLTDDDAI